MEIAPDIVDQHTTFVRGLGLMNRIVCMVLEVSTQLDLFGAEISHGERDTLMRLVFDLTTMMQPDGTFRERLETFIPSASSSDEEDGTDDEENSTDDEENSTDDEENGSGPEEHTILNRGPDGTFTLPIRDKRNGVRIEESTPSEEAASSHVSPTDETAPYEVDRISLSSGNEAGNEMDNALAEEGEDKARVDSGVGLDVVEIAQNGQGDDEKEEGEITDDGLD